MMLGEFESARTIPQVTPRLIPQPQAWGKLANENRPTYFYLSDFVDMDIATPPEPTQFAARVAGLHQNSTSSNNMFGFHVTTCDGKTAHTVAWERSWATFFGRLLRGVARSDREANGPWPALDAAVEQVAHHVVPRLLGALQSDGRPIRPCLIHGDLWDGNVGAHVETREIVLYDAGSYYAHNEMELGEWRCPWVRYLRDKAYMQQYLHHCPAVEPVDEFDDRNRLYSLKYSLNYSAGHPGSAVRRT